MHPLFTEQYDYDYALLRLEKKIDFGAANAPTPICLPPPNSFHTTFEGTTPWVVGWGMPDESAGATTRVLQKLAVPVIPIAKCSSWLPGLVTPRMICAGYEEGKKGTDLIMHELCNYGFVTFFSISDACTGDSGGPLILKQPNKQWWQIGIVSWYFIIYSSHFPSSN
jgi:hypothetical protein